MEAQEFNFKGFKANGFLMLAVHLLLISAAIVLCFIEKNNCFIYLAEYFFFFGLSCLADICNWSLTKPA